MESQWNHIVLFNVWNNVAVSRETFQCNVPCGILCSPVNWSIKSMNQYSFLDAVDEAPLKRVLCALLKRTLGHQKHDTRQMAETRRWQRPKCRAPSLFGAVLFSSLPVQSPSVVRLTRLAENKDIALLFFDWIAAGAGVCLSLLALF